MLSRSAKRFLFRLILLATPLALLALLVSGNADLFHTSEQQPCYPAGVSQGGGRQQDEDLQRQLQQLKLVIAQLEERIKRQDETATQVTQDNAPCSSSYIQKQIEQSEIEQGKKWHNEYEVIPHSLFTMSAFYPTEPGLGQKVVLRPIGTRRQDLQEAVSSALSVLNHIDPDNQRRYTAQNFTEGLYRIDPIEGTQYELWFAHEDESGNNLSYRKITLLRPHAPLSVVRVERTPLPRQTKEPILNIVVPLSGRLSAFQSFLNRLIERNVLSSSAGRVHLTVVFFGDEYWDEIQREMLSFERKAKFSNFHLLKINGTFSRARGLQIGVEHWEGSPNDQVLIFLCDVDVDFDHRFLRRCRRNANPNRQAYFPMVFSLYNPDYVTVQKSQSLRNGYHREGGTLNFLSKETGFWRDFGFGMVCTYRSDFLNLGGFHGGEKTGWGGEDLFLYRKYIRSPLRIIRSPDPNLFHLWHPKSCPGTLGPVQKQACLQSKVRTEASHEQLGLALFAFLEEKTNNPL